MSDKELMTIREAVAYSGRSWEVIRRAIAVGALPIYRHFSDLRYHRIRKDELESVMAEMEPLMPGKAPNGAGSIRRRMDGRFEFRTFCPDGVRRSFYGRSEDEARAKALKYFERSETAA